MKILKRLFILLCIGGGLFAAAPYINALFEEKTVGIPYRTDIITRGTIAELITATGTISPEEVVTVGTQVSGQITKMHVKLNDKVTKGQLLAEIDPSIVLTQLNQSKASLETAQVAYTLAQRDYERIKTLLAKDYVAKVELERSWQNVVSTKNQLESIKNQVERDEVNLGYTKVTSPIDGIIIEQEVSSGQTVASNFQTPNLFKIAKDMRVMKIDMNVPESDISKIHEGMPVQFSVDAFPNRAFTGVVSAVNLSPNNQSGVVTYNVVVKLENKDRALFPGMTANISVVLSAVNNVLRVPASALRFSPPKEKTSAMARILSSQRAADAESDYAGLRIYLWQGNKLKIVPVQTGASDDLYVEVRSDELKEGDVVVTGLLVQED
ncbi:MAG: efflux RND transporter periplasmic adaptor subunit [Alphaproteobacteria bacterium]|nr:efflux RND transporter periplasmic adaptor subunit [Alphaproteobacteria bacterium]